MAIGFFSNAKPAPTTEEHVIPQGIREIQLKLPPTRMLANFHAALYGFDQCKVLLDGWKEEGGERGHENVENRHVTGSVQSPSLQIPGYPCVLPQELAERSSSPVVFSWSCWSTAHMRAELGCEKDSATCCSAQDDLFPFERQELIPLMYPPHIVIFKGNKINFMFITS
ncbi:uncharacterized protein LOC129117810 isoform X2 [Agelaius phoeniceus]|uniref:uncharacterized protein LOC129117810 isoform X2 n=1 Tax=Agelaius phoeniceus TaxID=39638 RepID=UPI00405510E4